MLCILLVHIHIYITLLHKLDMINTLTCVDNFCDLRYTDGTGRCEVREGYNNHVVPSQV